MRFGMWCIACALAGAVPALAAPMANEPNGFLGIDWGASIDQHRSALKALREDGDFGHYRRPSDRPFFAGIEVRRISYHFYKGRFVGGTYTTTGSTEFKSIVSYLTERHGEPTRSHPRQRVYVWEGERSAVSVSCDISISCYTEYYDRALREQADSAHGGADSAER
jgi:hypothetical protein